MKNSKSSYIAIALLLVSVVGYKFFYKKKSIELPKYGSYLSCMGTPFDLGVKLKSHFYLLESAVPSEEARAQTLYFGAAWFHNYYTFVNILHQNQNTSLKWSSITEAEPKIKILSVEPAAFPYNVDFDQKEFQTSLDTFGFPPEPRAYLQKVGDSGIVTKGLPAKKVTYEYETDIFTCFNKNDVNEFKTLKFIQPLDPYLSYFVVPMSHRKELQNDLREARGVYNPCMNLDAITASGFNPFGHYGAWRPDAVGHGADKTPFDCTLFYEEGKTHQQVTVEFKENKPKDLKYIDFGHFENLERPIKAAFLFGAQESLIFQKFHTPEAKRLINLYLSEISTQDARSNLPTYQKKFDPNFSRMLLLLWNVSKHMDFVSKDIIVKDMNIEVILKGKLRLSKKDLELRYFFSPNNPRLSGSDFFDQAAVQELLTNDIVIYEGHSGGGNVFDKAMKVLRDDKSKVQDKSIQYQVLALYACSSSLFFRASDFPKIDSVGFKRDVIRTAGDYLDYMGNGSLALIASLDGYLYNQSYVPFAYWAQNFKSDNFYILSNHSF